MIVWFSSGSIGYPVHCVLRVQDIIWSECRAVSRLQLCRIDTYAARFMVGASSQLNVALFIHNAPGPRPTARRITSGNILRFCASLLMESKKLLQSCAKREFNGSVLCILFYTVACSKKFFNSHFPIFKKI